MAFAAPGRSPARSERAERTRQRILDAAGQSLAASGWAKTTVEAIAARAGVSKGIVYHHFRGKEQILEAVLERTLAEWDEACRREGWPEGESALQGLATMHRCALQYARDNPLLRAIFQLDPSVLLDMRRSAPVRRALEQFRAELVAAVRAGVESGELRPDLDVERTAEVVRILHLAFIDHLLNPEWIDASDDRLIDASLDVLFHGLAARPS
ncbi:MAG: TetR/AcrR family transcriptional regulator [Deltaproteobacteria bacterium]|nr:MAG: TetR/AcrR family transcriptional regulator [Deltaproteobacteria bacterium]